MEDEGLASVMRAGHSVELQQALQTLRSGLGRRLGVLRRGGPAGDIAASWQRLGAGAGSLMQQLRVAGVRHGRRGRPGLQWRLLNAPVLRLGVQTVSGAVPNVCHEWDGAHSLRCSPHELLVRDWCVWRYHKLFAKRSW